ncbi:MAG: glycosyltransferase, partial [Reyranella sp.]
VRAALDRALLRHDWDAIVFDSISGGWALGAVLHHCRLSDRAPAMVHIAHNHETTVARRIAEAASGLRRLYRNVDTAKVAWLERRLVAASALVTSNTPEDVATFETMKHSPVLFLPPGYDGPRVERRTIDASVPRRAVLVGSYDWPPKRISLEKFLEVATPRFAAADVALQIVGTAAPDYIEGLRRRFPGVTFTGPVDDVQPYMAAARIALVPDLLGGFKLKGLDYVFNRLPICAMRVALPAMPLVDGESVDHFDSHEALADGVIALIDDFATLNARQERAWAACLDEFDWPRLGRRLVDAIAKVVPAQSVASRAEMRSMVLAGSSAGRKMKL